MRTCSLDVKIIFAVGQVWKGKIQIADPTCVGVMSTKTEKKTFYMVF